MNVPGCLLGYCRYPMLFAFCAQVVRVLGIRWLRLRLHWQPNHQAGRQMPVLERVVLL